MPIKQRLEFCSQIRYVFEEIIWHEYLFSQNYFHETHLKSKLVMLCMDT